MQFEEEDLRSEITRGHHYVHIRQIEQRHSLNANPIVEVRMEIVEGGCSGAWLRDYFVIGGDNEKAAAIGKRRLARLCLLCGLDVAVGLEIDLQQIVGCALIADVSEATYQGRLVPRVRAYRRLEGGTPF